VRCHYFLIITVIEISVNIGQSQSFGITIHTFFSSNFLKQAYVLFQFSIMTANIRETVFLQLVFIVTCRNLKEIQFEMTILRLFGPICVHPCYVRNWAI
jgi:hypothetical protein